MVSGRESRGLGYSVPALLSQQAAGRSNCCGGQSCASGQRPEGTTGLQLSMADGERVLPRILAARAGRETRTGGGRNSGLLHGSSLGSGRGGDVLSVAVSFPI